MIGADVGALHGYWHTWGRVTATHYADAPRFATRRLSTGTCTGRRTASRWKLRTSIGQRRHQDRGQCLGSCSGRRRYIANREQSTSSRQRCSRTAWPTDRDRWVFNDSETRQTSSCELGSYTVIGELLGQSWVLMTLLSPPSPQPL